MWNSLRKDVLSRRGSLSSSQLCFFYGSKLHIQSLDMAESESGPFPWDPEHFSSNGGGEHLERLLTAADSGLFITFVQ